MRRRYWPIVSLILLLLGGILLAQTGSPQKSLTQNQAETDTQADDSGNTASAQAKSRSTADTEAAEQTASQKQAQKPARDAPDEGGQTKQSKPGGFKPSEEISEDQPVPFPVDI